VASFDLSLPKVHKPRGVLTTLLPSQSPPWVPNTFACCLRAVVWPAGETTVSAVRLVPSRDVPLLYAGALGFPRPHARRGSALLRCAPRLRTPRGRYRRLLGHRAPAPHRCACPYPLRANSPPGSPTPAQPPWTAACGAGAATPGASSASRRSRDASHPIVLVRVHGS
jgi:hypothetical protein